MRLVFMGTSDFAVPFLGVLVEAGHEVACVYTPPDRPAGRGQHLVASPVKRAAQAQALPLHQPASLRGAQEAHRLRGLAPEAVVVAAYRLLLPDPILSTPLYGCLNVHPSLLPAFRGASPIQAAILAGVAGTGVSIVQMDAGLDTGPIYAQSRMRIDDEDDAISLTSKLVAEGKRLLLWVLEELPSGALTPQPQRHEEASYCQAIDKADGQIDWFRPAREIWRRLRAFQPWPGAYTHWEGRLLKVLRARVEGESPALAPQRSNEARRLEPFIAGIGMNWPGEVVLLAQERGLAVRTGHGLLVLEKVQLEGGRAVSGADFLRGHRAIIGSILGH